MAARIDDAPVHSEYIKCFVWDEPDDGPLFNQEYFREYLSKTGEGQMAVLGAMALPISREFLSSVTHIMKGVSCTVEYLHGR